MKRRIAALLLAALALLLLPGCEAVLTEESSSASIAEILTPPETQAQTEEETDPAPTTLSPAAETVTEPLRPEDEPLPPSVEKDGSYTSPEDVAAYIHTFGTLPANFLTKKQAQQLGWDSSAGNLQDVAPGMSIGGDRFGNREGLLPEGDYRECDVNYDGGFRGAERLIYGTDGSIYYTNDHYKSFTQLY